MSESTNLLFTFLDSRQLSTARKVHIRRLYDILQLCIHRKDLPRARQAWSILARCDEVHWMSMWTTGLLLLCTDIDEGNRSPKRLEYLRTMMLRHQDDRERIIQELILQLIILGQYQEALDELELYLPSFPYQDNPVLHVYAGLVSLYLSQPSASSKLFDAALLRKARSHFENAKNIDSNSVLAQAFIEKIVYLTETNGGINLDSDDDGMTLDSSPRQKRIRA